QSIGDLACSSFLRTTDFRAMAAWVMSARPAGLCFGTTRLRTLSTCTGTVRTMAGLVAQERVETISIIGTAMGLAAIRGRLSMVGVCCTGGTLTLASIIMFKLIQREPAVIILWALPLVDGENVMV